MKKFMGTTILLSAILPVQHVHGRGNRLANPNLPSHYQSPVEIQRTLITKISSILYKIIEDSADESNAVFQSSLKKTFDKARDAYVRGIEKRSGQSRSNASIIGDFAMVWQEAMNHPIEVELRENPDLIDQQLQTMFDEQSSNNGSTTREPGKIYVKTVLLNILLRQEECLEKARKMQTMIEMGADKNLPREFRHSPKMANQSEYPMQIVLNELKDQGERLEAFDVLFNDKISYSLNHYLPESERLRGISDTIEPNKMYIAEKLVERKDFKTFNAMMTRAESLGIQFVEEYSDEMSQIQDQIWCPILEKILAKMRDLRRITRTTDDDGNKVDNISEFLKLDRMRKQMKKKGDSRFSIYFQSSLRDDFNSLFRKTAHHINASRLDSEIEGEQFKANLIEWVEWANFRNRVAKHLNKFALSASNNARKANVIRLIRYANIYDEASEGTDQGDLFKELQEHDGAAIIFTTKNKLKWTPAMYAMVQKQAEGIQLLLKQAYYKVTETDGVGNNIFHLAFPLPEQFFKSETYIESENVLEMVGANLGDASAQEKTTEAIKAITTEPNIPTPDKIAGIRQLSSANFTPVSLAAATGNIETYEFLKRFLIQENAWNEDEHAYLGTHIDELVVDGLNRYFQAKRKQGDLTVDEEKKLEKEIESRSKLIKDRYKVCVHEVYRPDLDETVKRLKALEGPAMKVIGDFYAAKATKRRKEPYQKALTVAIELMQKSRGSLRGMKQSTSVVKASYLGPVVKQITKEFLQHKTSPRDMTFDKVYEGLTGSSEKDFFAKSFNATIEKRMQVIIYNTIKNSGRLRVEAEQEDANRFAGVEDLYLTDTDDSDDEEDLIDESDDEGNEENFWDI
ncbi:MAG: hypothetical protein HRU09_09710 [Oligoflexales bacterium]|nr:hypothetical protein [Oligoflexales bacterium]